MSDAVSIAFVNMGGLIVLGLISEVRGRRVRKQLVEASDQVNSKLDEIGEQTNGALVKATEHIEVSAETIKQLEETIRSLRNELIVRDTDV